MKISATAEKIQTQLTQKIIEQIDVADGAIHFSDFMQMALYTPSLGYYQNELIKFGKRGDFITAPEMGDLFARGIARAISGSLGESSPNLLEIGAGSGILAADLLLTLSAMNTLPEHYYILEPGRFLQQQQFQTLQQKAPQLLDRVSWLSGLPESFNGVILANEVLDAIPCELIQLNQGNWHYLGVSHTEGQLSYQVMGLVPEKDLPEALQSTHHFAEGYKTEIRLLVRPWLKSLANCLNSGSVMLFDYGYPQRDFYHPQRTQGSLCCFSRHQRCDNPLQRVGVQDITAHVDFTDVAQAAVSAGLAVEGFTTQSGFLIENGIVRQQTEQQKPEEPVIANQAKTNKNIPRYQFSQQVQKLTAPGQMGEVVKVLLLGKKTEQTIKGFALQDHLYRL